MYQDARWFVWDFQSVLSWSDAWRVIDESRIETIQTPDTLDMFDVLCARAGASVLADDPPC